ncbi:hypothetical protein SAMN02800694_2366 [Luteibacter sp. UNCMF331Sha3.1]|nr:hypothetical protein [Luteibacter sp. UNCMF331Sha3.1]SEM97969.1 hypothetical protein SAMN02800694_2366 [Luteibacter sp. UNCMF331Sha3.1]
MTALATIGVFAFFLLLVNVPRRASARIPGVRSVLRRRRAGP